MSTLDEEAAAIVAEMADLGAVFDLAGESAWTWEARPPAMRDAIRAYLAKAEITRPGMQAAMVRAIMRTTQGASVS